MGTSPLRIRARYGHHAAVPWGGWPVMAVSTRNAHLAPENIRAAVTLLEGVESRTSHAGNLKVVDGGR